MALFTQVPFETILSMTSATLTGYFWLIRSRRERPDLKMYQLQDFRAMSRRSDPDKDTKRISITQMSSGGVLVSNNSLMQNSIIRFDCFLKHDKKWIKGDWGYINDDKPPWNVPPQTTITMSIACFFEVPQEFESNDDTSFRVELITVSGKRFPHTFTLKNRQDA